MRPPKPYHNLAAFLSTPGS